MPQTSGFRSAKEILVVSFATQPRAFILSDRNIFYTPPGGGTTAFLVITLFSTATSGCSTLFCRSDRSCAPHTSYLGRRCLILAVLLGYVTGLGSDPQ